MAKIKKYRWEIDEDDVDSGVKVVSFVDAPAMESNFIAFSKQKPVQKFVKLEEEGYKQVVAGLALIPDKEIPRVDPDTGDEYVGYFEAETIEKIRNKFHKEQNDQNVNTDHEEDQVVDAYLIESYILSSDKQVEDLKDKGIEEAIIGSWFTAYKIEDEETFQAVLDGELNGFSVELYADRILENFKYNNNNKTKFSMKNLIEKLKALLNEYDSEPVVEKTDVVLAEESETETKLERAPVPSLEIIIEWNEVGDPVNSVVTDENGEETLEPLADGEYELDDGKIIVVTDDVLAEIKEAPAEEEAEVKAEVEDEAEVKAEDEVEVKSAKDILTELGIDFSNDGYYTIEVGVENGEPVWGTVYASTYKDLKFKAENFEAKEQEIVDLKETVDQLNTKLSEAIAEPVTGHGETNGKLKEDDVDLSKLSNYERIAHKNGLPIM